MTGQFRPVDQLQRDDPFMHNLMPYWAAAPGYKDAFGHYFVRALYQTASGDMRETLLSVFGGSVYCTDITIPRRGSLLR